MRILALAGAETRLLARDKALLFSATAIPLLFAFALIQNRDMFLAEVASSVAATQVILMLTFTVYGAATMALAGRRADLYLKRLRNSPLSNTGIVAGLSLPLFLIAVLQLAVVLTTTGSALDSTPARPGLLVLAVVVGSVMCVALAFLTAAFTRTPQAAQMTTLPVVVVFVIGTFWPLLRPIDDVGLLPQLVPGGGAVQLARIGWAGVPDGGPTELLTLAGTAVAGSVLATVVSCLVAPRIFSWEPRN